LVAVVLALLVLEPVGKRLCLTLQAVAHLREEL
jgi:hypothetical protein